MSIIIRLQNLPWAANSGDIRQYFSGLSIPDGGVHIVGGEKGDAFIAFGTDEDARQAMERDGGNIKDMKVKLLLSSRTEMTRVIEQARNQNMVLQPPAAVKAAANDSDRRKVRSPSPSSSSSSRRREKSPSRDKRRSSKRDRSRTRSRSPRKNKDRESDRRRDSRTRRDDRHTDDSHDRYKSRDTNSKDSSSSQDRRKHIQTNKDSSRQSSSDLSSKPAPFNPQAGSTPPTYDFRQADRFPSGARNTSYGDPQNRVPGDQQQFLFPSAANVDSQLERKPVQPGFNQGAYEPPFDKRTMGNYEAKRPSPTPGTSAPNVGSNAPYDKDPFGSSMAHNYRDYNAPTYGNVQTAERGAVPAVPNERRLFQSNQPVYGAEPHARYDQIPEANQAGRSANAPAPMTGHESQTYGKINQPAHLGASDSSNRLSRRSRFEPEQVLPDDGQYPPANTASADQRSYDPYNRQMNQRSGPGVMDNNFQRANVGNEASWPGQHPSTSRSGNWSKNNYFAGQANLSMDTDAIHVAQTAPSMRNSGPSGFADNRNVRPGLPPDNRMQAREPYGHRSDHPSNINYESKPPSGAQMPSNHAHPSNRNTSSYTVEMRNLPFDASDKSIADIFRGIFIPDINIRIKRNTYGKPTGYAYVKFLNERDFEDGLRKGKEKTANSQIQIVPCPLSLFENVQEASDANSDPLAGISFPPHKPADSNSSVRIPVNNHISSSKSSDALSRSTSDVNSRKREAPIQKPMDSKRLSPQKTLDSSRKSSDSLHSRQPPDSDRKIESFPMRNKLPPPSSSNKHQDLKFQPKNPSQMEPKNIEPPSRAYDMAQRLPDEAMVSRKPMEHMPSSRKMPRSHQSNLEPCAEDLCVELKGLPYTCCDDEIIHFFDGLGILDVFIEVGADGSATGVGFVEFATPADFHAAMNLTGKRIGHRYVDVLIASKEIMAVARGERTKLPLLPQGPLQPAPPPQSMPQARRPLPPESQTFCMSIHGLPPHVNSRDVADFFAQVSVVPRAIHIMLSSNKTPTGEAFAQFNNPREYETAFQNHGCLLQGTRISLCSISYEEMVDILGSPPNISGVPLLRNPADNEPSSSRRPLMLPMEDEMPLNDHMPPFDHPDRMGPRPPFPRMMGMPPRPGFRHNGPSRGPGPFHVRHSGPPMRFPPGGPRNGHGPTDFGVPGCVVAIDNLHYRAGLEDLLNFFHDYDIDKNGVIRKYNENGQPTAEARISFNCPEDAHHAVTELNMKPLMGRPINLSLV